MKPQDATEKACKIGKGEGGNCLATGCMHWKVLIPTSVNHPGWGRCAAMDYQEAYKLGYRDGIAAYAINREGQQVVGDGTRTLNEALEKIEVTWNYLPRIQG